MPRAETELQKHTMNLYPGDYATLQQLFPDIGASVVIRKIVRRFIEQCEGEGQASPDNVNINL